jgi:hypothetical protein
MKRTFSTDQLRKLSRDPNVARIILIFATANPIFSTQATECFEISSLLCKPHQVLPASAKRAAAMIVVEETGYKLFVTNEWKEVTQLTEFANNMMRSLADYIQERV